MSEVYATENYPRRLSLFKCLQELKDKPTSRGRKPKAFRQGNAELN